MNTKKILSAIIAGTMALSAMSLTAMADATVSTWDGETVDTSWYTEDATEYEISSAAQFAGLAKLVNDGTTKFNGKTVNLTTDIDLNQMDWTPIGSDEDDTSFCGTFNGNNHTISNLWVNAADDYLGLFGYAGTFGEDTEVIFKDFTLNNATVISSVTSGHGGSYVGGVFGNCRVSTITNVDLTGEITIQGYGYVGGIVGHGYPKMTDCDVTAEGTINCYYWCCGALVGYMGEGQTDGIRKCTVTSVGEGLTLWSAYGGIGAACGLLQDGTTLDNVVATDVVVEADSDYCVGYISGGNNSTNSTATGVEVTVDGETYTPADAESVTVISYVAEINGVGYETLEAAVTAANSGDVVTLLADVDALPFIDKAITIKGAEGTEKIKVAAGNGENQFGSIDGTVTIENIAFTNGSAASRTDYASNDNSKLTIKYVNCDFNEVSATYAIQAGASWNNHLLGGLVLDGCTLTASATSDYTPNYMIYAQCVSNVTIKNCVIDGQHNYRGAIHLGDSTEYATVAVIENNEIKNFARGVQTGNRVEGSSITVTGNTFTGIQYSDKDSKAEYESAAIFVHENANADVLDIVVTENDFTGVTNDPIYSENTSTITGFVSTYESNTPADTTLEEDTNEPNAVTAVTAKKIDVDLTTATTNTDAVGYYANGLSLKDSYTWTITMGDGAELSKSVSYGTLSGEGTAVVGIVIHGTKDSYGTGNISTVTVE